MLREGTDEIDEAALEREPAVTSVLEHRSDARPDKNLRQIEELVADHRLGDHPDDPPDPEARTHVVRFELAAETFALLRQARTVLDDEHGKNLPDDPFVAALCSAVLDGAPAGAPTGRAKFQIAITVCQRCRQGWQEGAGAQIAVAPAVVERDRASRRARRQVPRPERRVPALRSRTRRRAPDRDGRHRGHVPLPRPGPHGTHGRALSLAGAEAILRLRALRTSGDFDDYWLFHLAKEHERTHQSRYADAKVPNPLLPTRPHLTLVK